MSRDIFRDNKYSLLELYRDGSPILQVTPQTSYAYFVLKQKEVAELAYTLIGWLKDQSETRRKEWLKARNDEDEEWKKVSDSWAEIERGLNQDRIYLQVLVGMKFKEDEE